jgi:hypothetical protein
MEPIWRGAGSFCPKLQLLSQHITYNIFLFPFHFTPWFADGAYLEGFREYLSQAAQAGERARPNPGAGAEASGQAHLWRDFGGMKTKQRIALVQEMQKVRGGCGFVCAGGMRGVC